MGWRTATTVWTDDMDARLCRLLADGHTGGQIGEALGVGRSAVSGRINRLREAGDPRVRPAAPSPIRWLTATRALAPIDAVAEAMAAGCPTLEIAADRLRMPIADVRHHWRRICAKLGAQAA